jgi:hypothetical protein
VKRELVAVEQPVGWTPPSNSPQRQKTAL